jgi:photosystem II stability/assembly factor-like uncharacterized protein
MKNTMAALALVAVAMTAVATGQAGAPGPVASAGEWTEFTANLHKHGEKNFRLDIAVDRKTGRLFVAKWSNGVWMSDNRGETFKRSDGEKVSRGGPFSCYALFADPAGDRLAVFNMNNRPGSSGYTLDGGKTWTSFESVGRNWDYGAVDWDSKVVIALRHEHPGVHVSKDMGKTWKQVDISRRRVKGVGVLPGGVLVVCEAGRIKRSEDHGRTWETVAEQNCRGTVSVFEGVGYWLAYQYERSGGEIEQKALILVTKDKGKTWKPLGEGLKDAVFCTGPCFGKSADHLVVGTLESIVESTDGGRTWKKVAAYPPDTPDGSHHKNGCAYPSVAYDPTGDVFYAYLVGRKHFGKGQLWRYERKGGE